MADYIDQSANISAALPDGLPASKTGLRGVLETFDSAFGGISQSYNQLPGETGVLNPWYPPGDARRYGIFPDGATNWEGVYGPRVVAWMKSCTLPGVIGLLPPGHYATGLNWSSQDYAGAQVRVGGAIIGGIFHVQSSAAPAIGDPKLTGLRFMGDFTVLDRLGLNNIQDVTFDRVHLKSDAANNVSTPGSKGRGCHIYFGCKDVSIAELVIDDCESGNNCDAALAIDGNGDNPQRIRIGRAWIKASDCHGAYITGLDQWIGDLSVDAYSATGPIRGLQDSDGLAQSQEGCGVWINRSTGYIGSIQIGQGSGARSTAKYDLRLDETDIAGPQEFRIDRIIVKAAGKGGAGRGVCLGDRNYASGTGQVTASIGAVTITSDASAPLEAGYQLLQVNQRAAGTRVSIDGDINFVNPSTNQGLRVEAGARMIRAGVVRYYSTGGGTARGTAAEDLGTVRAPLGVEYLHNGGSVDVPAVIWGAATGSVLGAITCDATTTTTKQALRHTATGTQVGPVSSNNLRSASGTVAINGGADCTLLLGTIAGGGTISAGTLGLRATGTITDFRLTGGKLTGFDTGIAKGTVTLTRLSASNLISTGNTTNTNLATADITQIGACSNIAI